MQPSVNSNKLERTQKSCSGIGIIDRSQRGAAAVTIDQLIQELQRHRDQHGGSCRVLMTWEGTVREIAPANIYPEAAADLWDSPEQDGSVLLIDAEAYPESHPPQ
jgi:hypothetical protein